MDKYYTPSIEEFHAGFEYEEEVIIYTDKGWFTHKGLGWEKRVFSSTDYMENYYLSERVKRGLVGKYNTTIRVKYLDKDDLEELGFKCIKAGDKAINDKIYDTDIWQIGELTLVDNCIIIYPYPLKHCYCISSNSGYSGGMSEIIDTRFIGIIKNKSELIKLLKQLGIDNNE